MLKDYFHVQLGSAEQLAIPLDNATEAISAIRLDVCPIPGVPAYLLGVINQRGRLLWMLDLATLLGIELPKQWGGDRKTDRLSSVQRSPNDNSRQHAASSSGLRGLGIERNDFH